MILRVLVLALLPSIVGAATPITAPGVYPGGDYYLANDISSTGTVLKFAASSLSDRVVLNLNGKTIRCQTDGNAVTIGVQGSGPANLIIEGGGASWIDGCRMGVSSSRPTRVQEVVFTNTKHIAINLSGQSARAILNVINGVGGVTDEAYAVGINVTGPSPIVRGNKILNVYRQSGAPPEIIGEGVPIIVNAASTYALVEMNFLSNATVEEGSIGVYAGIGTGHQILDNVVRNFDFGIATAWDALIGRNALSIDGPTPGSTGVLATIQSTVSENLVVGYPSGQEVVGSPMGSGNLWCLP